MKYSRHSLHRSNLGRDGSENLGISDLTSYGEVFFQLSNDISRFLHHCHLELEQADQLYPQRHCVGAVSSSRFLLLDEWVFIPVGRDNRLSISALDCQCLMDFAVTLQLIDHWYWSARMYPAPSIGRASSQLYSSVWSPPHIHSSFTIKAALSWAPSLWSTGSQKTSNRLVNKLRHTGQFWVKDQRGRGARSCGRRQVEAWQCERRRLSGLCPAATLQHSLGEIERCVKFSQSQGPSRASRRWTSEVSGSLTWSLLVSCSDVRLSRYITHVWGDQSTTRVEPFCGWCSRYEELHS